MDTTLKQKPKKEKLDPIVLRVVLVLLVGALAPLLDSTMMNVAIHTVAADMKATISTVQWVTTGYILAMGLAIPISGWATKRFGCKRSYIFSLVIFLIGSVCSMLSWNIESLIVFRVIQGVGAGLMVPVMQTELVQISGGRNLGRMMSFISIPGLLGPILGPVLGGIIVSSLGWRAIFWINIPICIVAIPLSVWGIPADKHLEKKASLDVIGLLLLSPAFALLVYGIAQIATHGGLNSSAVYVPLIIGVVLMASYVVYALNTKREPALNVRLFKSVNFSASNILLMLQRDHHERGLVDAAALLPGGARSKRPVCRIVAASARHRDAADQSWAGRTADRDGSRNIVLLSLAAIVIGTLPFAFAGADTNLILLAAALLIRGAGLGGLFIAIMASALYRTSKRAGPHASIATRIFNTIGGAFGAAILATVLQRQTAGHAVSDLHAISNAFNVSFWWAIGFTVVAAIPTLFLTMRKKAEPEKASQLSQ